MDDDVNILFDRMGKVAKETRILAEDKTAQLFEGVPYHLDVICRVFLGNFDNTKLIKGFLVERGWVGRETSTLKTSSRVVQLLP